MTAKTLPNELEHKTLSYNQQLLLRGILEKGLPLVEKPYYAIAEQIKANEEQVIAQIKQWQTQGLIKRFGLVVKHRQLGYNANAMVVWNIDDSQVDEIAGLLSKRKEISLCYRRPRRLPDWPYNLFCMIHGKSRIEVEAQIDKITQELSLQNIEKDVLFSTIAYKQHGARYLSKNKVAI
jgi:DNA-binding Lrp family transcriptional regulator